MRDFSQDVHFSRIIDGQLDRVDIATVALEIARDEYPRLEIASWIARLDRMGMQVRERVVRGEAPEVLIRHVNQFLFEEEGLRGNSDEYYDPRNSFLNDVLERKLGIPITLSIVYMAVAKRVGLELHGVGMPGHFIVKVVGARHEIFVDPFHRGAILTRESCEHRVSQVVGVPVELSPDQLESSPTDQIVLRLLGNLKAIYGKESDYVRGLRVQERICAIAPKHAAECRDLGVLYLHNDRPAKAADQLEAYRRMLPEADDHEAIDMLLRVAARMQASMN